jgi:hypothetical protein
MKSLWWFLRENPMAAIIAIAGLIIVALIEWDRLRLHGFRLNPAIFHFIPLYPVIL